MTDQGEAPGVENASGPDRRRVHPITVFRSPVGDIGKHHGLLSVIYLIANRRGDDRLKIGMAADMQRRLGDYMLHNPDTIVRSQQQVRRIIARSVERAVHKELAPYRIQGEWFRVDFALARRTVARVIRDGNRFAWRLEDAWSDGAEDFNVVVRDYYANLGIRL